MITINNLPWENLFKIHLVLIRSAWKVETSEEISNFFAVNVANKGEKWLKQEVYVKQMLKMIICVSMHFWRVAKILKQPPQQVS